MKTSISRGAWVCFHCGEVLPRSVPTCCGPVPRLVWDDGALDVEIEVSASWTKPHSGLFDRGGGCIEPPSSGEWDDFCAEVDGREFPLSDDEEEDALNEFAMEDDGGGYDPREDRDEERDMAEVLS